MVILIAKHLAVDYPFSKILRKFVSNQAMEEDERYQSTMHERDQELCSNREYPLKNNYKNEQTGFDFRGARYYDSVVARFLSTDPLAADYMAWSTYNYVMGNPVMLVDPTGMGAEGCDTCPDEEEYDIYRELDYDFSYNSEDKEVTVSFGPIDFPVSQEVLDLLSIAGEHADKVADYGLEFSAWGFGPDLKLGPLKIILEGDLLPGEFNSEGNVDFSILSFNAGVALGPREAGANGQVFIFEDSKYVKVADGDSYSTNSQAGFTASNSGVFGGGIKVGPFIPYATVNVPEFLSTAEYTAKAFGQFFQDLLPN